MNWRRIFTVMKVRIGMIAVILFALILIRAGALKEKGPKPAIRPAGTGLEYKQLLPFKVNHIHRLYFFPNEEKEAEAEVEESGNAIVLREKMYRDGNLREEHEYDTMGNVVKGISYDEYGSIYIWYENEYDSKGKPIKHVSRERNGDIKYERVYEYNENGDVVKVCKYVDGSIEESEECEYDKDGNCTKDTVYYWDGSIREWSEFTYDEMGNRTKEIVYRGAETDNIYSWREYEYDEKGNETRVIRYNADGSLDIQRKYEYDRMGNCTDEIRYNGDGTISSRYSYQYDTMGNETKVIVYDGNGNISYRHEYKYDEAGREIRHTDYNDRGIIKYCCESENDEMGNLIKENALEEGAGYQFNIFGELFVFKTMKEKSVTEYEYEYASETAGQIRSTVIGDVEILEKSLQTTIEVEGWSRVRTWDLKYPYFSGDNAVLLGEINNQIYEWVRDKNMVDSEAVYYTELTYEITYMDERFVSILFEGEGGGNSYYGYSHGMNFDLKTGKLLSLTDFYEWPEWKGLMENAMEQGQLRTQILRGDMELEEEENREYLEEYFIPLFQEDSDLKKGNLDFYIKDGYLYFITHAYPSCREDSYVKWEDKKDDLKEQGEEKTPLMSGEEFDKIIECLDEQVPEIWNEWADYIREQSGGEAHLIERMAGEYLPDDVYRDYEKTEYLGKYYMFYVGEIREDHSVVWAYFYVSEDFSEVLWYDLVQGMDSEYPVLYLDEWRNSDHYPKLEDKSREE